MAYKRTGRPPGRPKTKWYVTVMTRIPEDLAAQAKRYAALHRHTMSDVLRDGLLLLLQEQDPYRPSMSDTHAAQAIMSDVNPLPAVEVREIVSDTKEDVSSILYDTKEVCATVERTATCVQGVRQRARPAAAPTGQASGPARHTIGAIRENALCSVRRVNLSRNSWQGRPSRRGKGQSGKEGVCIK